MKVNVSNDRFEINCITFGIDYVIRHSTLVEAITVEHYSPFLADSHPTGEQKEWEKLLYMMDFTTISLLDNFLKEWAGIQKVVRIKAVWKNTRWWSTKWASLWCYSSPLLQSMTVICLKRYTFPRTQPLLWLGHMWIMHISKGLGGRMRCNEDKEEPQIIGSWALKPSNPWWAGYTYGQEDCLWKRER